MIAAIKIQHPNQPGLSQHKATATLYSWLLGLSKLCPLKMETFRLLRLFPMSRLQNKYPFHSSYCYAKHLYIDTLQFLETHKRHFRPAEPVHLTVRKVRTVTLKLDL